MLAMRTVCVFPPRLSCSSRVSLDSRYGTGSYTFKVNYFFVTWKILDNFSQGSQGLINRFELLHVPSVNALKLIDFLGSGQITQVDLRKLLLNESHNLNLPRLIWFNWSNWHLKDAVASRGICIHGGLPDYPIALSPFHQSQAIGVIGNCIFR